DTVNRLQRQIRIRVSPFRRNRAEAPVVMSEAAAATLEKAPVREPATLLRVPVRARETWLLFSRSTRPEMSGKAERRQARMSPLEQQKGQGRLSKAPVSCSKNRF